MYIVNKKEQGISTRKIIKPMKEWLKNKFVIKESYALNQLKKEGRMIVEERTGRFFP